MFNQTANLFLAGGSIMPILNNLCSTLYITRDEASLIWNQLKKAIHPMDIIVISFLIYVPLPLYHASLGRAKTLTKSETCIAPFVYQFCRMISGAARLARIVYLFDLGLVTLVGAGVQFHKMETLSFSLAKVLYMAWAASVISDFKKYIIGKYFARKPEKLGVLVILDRALDGVIYMITIFFLYEIFDTEMGIGVSSVLTLGSFGTIAVGLASQNMANMFVSGLALSTTDHFHDGDQVLFSDGTAGIVQKMGWMETSIRGFDNIIEVIPNSKLGMQSVKNLSRVKLCQVKQTLRFRYKDADKLERVCQDILATIQQECPKVISDGSKAFRAHWTGYQKDHLEVVVNTHHNVKPVGQEYWDNREKVLRAIHKAVKKNGAQFVTTIWPQESVK